MLIYTSFCLLQLKCRCCHHLLSERLTSLNLKYFNSQYLKITYLKIPPKSLIYLLVYYTLLK